MTFHIYTLGCKVNSYETNVMIDALENHGYKQVSLEESADISIINTCTVTNTADQKSKKIIRHAIKQSPNSIIIVVGCLSQNKQQEVADIEGVSIVLGNFDKSKIVDYIEDYQKNKKQQVYIIDMKNVPFETMKLNNFNKTRAFVKIQDGCNNFCSYCIIPYTRGDVRSKPRYDVIDEITTLIKNGHKEIVLTGIHTGNYGAEFENYDFATLLEELVTIKGLERLRISSIEITELNDRVLNVLKTSPILVDHMHIPLQSGSDTVLKRMNRKYDKAYFIDKINTIRKIRPDISITTDVIVGFPGETETEFSEMIETIERVKFAKLHVFPYSRREGTVADKMDNQIEESVKKQRVHRLLELSKQLELEYMNQFINKTLYFLPEVYRDGYLIGHTSNYLTVKTKGEQSQLNNDLKIKIEKIDYPYVIGTKID